MSKFELLIIEDNNFSFGKNKKLIAKLGNKKKYKLNYPNIKPYLYLELQLKKFIGNYNSNKNHF